MKRNILTGIIVIIILSASFALINFYPMLSMSPAETDAICDTGIIAIKNNINSVFFIQTESGYIVIDAGTNKNTVEKALDELSIDPANVQYVLLTHSDYEHSAGRLH